MILKPELLGLAFETAMFRAAVLWRLGTLCIAGKSLLARFSLCRIGSVPHAGEPDFVRHCPYIQSVTEALPCGGVFCRRH